MICPHCQHPDAAHTGDGCCDCPTHPDRGDDRMKATSVHVQTDEGWTDLTQLFARLGPECEHACPNLTGWLRKLMCRNGHPLGKSA